MTSGSKIVKSRWLKPLRCFKEDLPLVLLIKMPKLLGNYLFSHSWTFSLHCNCRDSSLLLFVLQVIAKMSSSSQGRALHLTSSFSVFLMICFHQVVWCILRGCGLCVLSRALSLPHAPVVIHQTCFPQLQVFCPLANCSREKRSADKSHFYLTDTSHLSLLKFCTLRSCWLNANPVIWSRQPSLCTKLALRSLQ